MGKHKVEILSLASGEIEFDSCLNLQGFEPTRRLSLGIYFAGNLQTLTTELVVETFQDT